MDAAESSRQMIRQDKASAEPVAARRSHRPRPRQRLNQQTLIQTPVDGFDATDDAAPAVEDSQSQSHPRLTTWENPCPDGTTRPATDGDTGEESDSSHHQNKTHTDDQSLDNNKTLLLHPQRGQSQATLIHKTEQHPPSAPAAARATSPSPSRRSSKKRSLDSSYADKQVQLIHKPRALEALAKLRRRIFRHHDASYSSYSSYSSYASYASSDSEPPRPKKRPFGPEPLAAVGPRDGGDTSSCGCCTFVKESQLAPLPPVAIGEEGDDTVGWLQPEDYAAYDKHKQAARDLYPDLEPDSGGDEGFGGEYVDSEVESESETDEERTILLLNADAVEARVKVEKSSSPHLQQSPASSTNDTKGHIKQEATSDSTKLKDIAKAKIKNEIKFNKLLLHHVNHIKATTRLRACIRCRMQKLKCIWDPRDPHTGCTNCSGYDLLSKRTLHRVPCMRYKISDVQVFRMGGLRLTTRWTGSAMRDVADRLPGVAPRIIGVSQLVCEAPIRLRVCRFRPRSGDVSARFWTDKVDGVLVRRKTELAAWCLEDIHAAAHEVEAYVRRNAISALNKQIKELKAEKAVSSSVLVARVYAACMGIFTSIAEKSPGERTLKEQIDMALMGNLFVLWLSMRLSTGSSWLDVSETLDMQPDSDVNNPMGSKISLPRMVVAQFDSLNCSRIIPKYRKRVISILENLIIQGNPDSWFVIFLTLFVLLREAAWTSADRSRHARNNYGPALRYSIPDFVQELQHGCNNLLAHWNYYNPHPWPQPGDDDYDRLKSCLADLPPEHWGIVMDTLREPEVHRHQAIFTKYVDDNGRIDPDARRLAAAFAGTQDGMLWDATLYWVAQLVEADWTPHATYFGQLVPEEPPLYEEVFGT